MIEDQQETDNTDDAWQEQEIDDIDDDQESWHHKAVPKLTEQVLPYGNEISALESETDQESSFSKITLMLLFAVIAFICLCKLVKSFK